MRKDLGKDNCGQVMPFMPLSTEGWLPPVRVLLHAKPANAFAIQPFLPFGAELRICQAKAPNGRLTKPSEKILEEFIALRGQSDKDVFRFARRYGGLHLYDRQDASDADIKIEYCDVWRYFARSMKALLSLSDAIYAGSPGPPKIGKISKICQLTCRCCWTSGYVRKTAPIWGRRHAQIQRLDGL